MFLFRKLLSAVLLLALVVWGVPAAADEPPNEADTHLTKFAEHVTKAERFSTNVDFAVTVGLPGLTHERGLKYRLEVNRPHEFSLMLRDKEGGPSVVGNRRTITTYVAELDQYTESKAPESLNAYSESIEAMMLLPHGMGHLVMSLLADDPAARLTASSTERKYLGREQIDGIDCVHLRIVEEQADFDVWITAGPEPKLRRIRPDLSKSFGEEEREAGFQVTISLDFTDWDFAPKFDDKTFAFVPPTGARRVESFTARTPEKVLPPIVAAHPLVGKAAPKFELKGYETQDDLKLEEVLGKKVIVLDFWASFCETCERQVPKLAAVAKEFGSEEVVFRAINPYEERDAIGKFLDRHELELPVLLDPEGKVKDLYHAQEIPQLVLIGKDGRVHVVHRGLPDEFEVNLRRDLRALVAGDDLTKKSADQPVPAKVPPPEESNKEP